MVYNFLCKDEKTRRNIYLRLLKTSVWKEVRHFLRTVYPNRNHVTTHPVNTLLLMHSTFMLSVVKMPLKGEVGGQALNSHGNYIVDHGKIMKLCF